MPTDSATISRAIKWPPETSAEIGDWSGVDSVAQEVVIGSPRTGSPSSDWLSLPRVWKCDFRSATEVVFRDCDDDETRSSSDHLLAFVLEQEKDQVVSVLEGTVLEIGEHYSLVEMFVADDPTSVVDREIGTDRLAEIGCARTGAAFQLITKRHNRGYLYEFVAVPTQEEEDDMSDFDAWQARMRSEAERA